MTIRQNLIRAYVRASVEAKETNRKMRELGRKLTEEEWRAAEIEACEIALEKSKEKVRACRDSCQ
jgi:hypothetical protein